MGRARRVAGYCRDRGAGGYRWVRRHFVYFITKDKIVQAIMTSAAFGVVTAGAQTFGVGVNALLDTLFGLRIPRPSIVLGVMIAVFVAAMWADHHTEEWREMVERTTGEEAAEDDDDTPDDADPDTHSSEVGTAAE